MTTVYNPISATLREHSTRLEADLFRHATRGFRSTGRGFWLRQRSEDGQAIINAKSSRQQGIELGGVTVFRFDDDGHFRDRIEAKSATLEDGHWRLEERALLRQRQSRRSERDTFLLKTTLTPAQVGESFATPETVPFWELPSYIDARRKRRAGGRRLSAAVLPAVGAALLSRWRWCCWPPRSACGSSAWAACRRSCSAASRAGFPLYVLSKITGDMSKAGLMAPMAAAGLPALLGRR